MHSHMRLQTVCNDFSSLCRLPPDQLCFRFGDQYEAALVDLIKKRAGQPITKKERPAAGNVVDLMDALRRSVGGAEPAKLSKPSKEPRKAASGQKEMLMSTEGKKSAKEAAAKKTASKP
jgi:DNA end-binding protein Ku